MKGFVVMVPTDLSEDSTRALEFALTLRQQHLEFKVVLLHVIAPTDLIEAPLGLPVRVIRQGAAASEVSLENMAASYANEFDVAVERMIDLGPVGFSVCQAAKRLSADMIIMTRGKQKGLRKAFLGSVAEYVVGHTPCPVLVLP